MPSKPTDFFPPGIVISASHPDIPNSTHTTCTTGTSSLPRWPSSLSWRCVSVYIRPSIHPLICLFHQPALTSLSLAKQHIVYFAKFILSYVIPDVPYAVKEQMKREKYLTQVILHETNLKLVTKRLKNTGTDDHDDHDDHDDDDDDDNNTDYAAKVTKDSFAMDKLELELDF